MRKATRQKPLDLWLDEADLVRLNEPADGWAISRRPGLLRRTATKRVYQEAAVYREMTNKESPDKFRSSL